MYFWIRCQRFAVLRILFSRNDGMMVIELLASKFEQFGWRSSCFAMLEKIKRFVGNFISEFWMKYTIEQYKQWNVVGLLKPYGSSKLNFPTIIPNHFNWVNITSLSLTTASATSLKQAVTFSVAPFHV